MFGGIVETTGEIKNIEEIAGCRQLVITSQLAFNDLNIGDSIAVNGVCLTITAFDATTFTVTVVPETLRLTNLAFLQPKQNVNLERAITMNTRLGGHYVQGHVDTVGTIMHIAADDKSEAKLVKISLPAKFTKYIVKKGYIALDGMSITVIDVGDDWFSVTFIPHTQQATIVNQYLINYKMNIEVDLLGKYIEKLLPEHKHAN